MKLIFITLIMICTTAGFAQSKLLLGNQYYRSSQFELAERQYRSALETEPGNTTALYNLANALQRQKKFADAVKVYHSLLSITRDTALRTKAYYNQGVAHSNAKELEQSIEAYKNCLRINPEDVDARFNLQKALSELKQKQQQQDKDKKKSRQEPKMSEKEADQKLKLLQQKERNLQQEMRDRSKQSGSGQAQDW